MSDFEMVYEQGEVMGWRTADFKLVTPIEDTNHALALSSQKWHKIASLMTGDVNVQRAIHDESCACCITFHTDGVSCGSCPIADAYGDGCGGTPWLGVSSRFSALRSHLDILGRGLARGKYIGAYNNLLYKLVKIEHAQHHIIIMAKFFAYMIADLRTDNVNPKRVVKLDFNNLYQLIQSDTLLGAMTAYYFSNTFDVVAFHTTHRQYNMADYDVIWGYFVSMMDGMCGIRQYEQLDSDLHDVITCNWEMQYVDGLKVLVKIQEV